MTDVLGQIRGLDHEGCIKTTWNTSGASLMSMLIVYSCDTCALTPRMVDWITEGRLGALTHKQWEHLEC